MYCGKLLKQDATDVQLIIPANYLSNILYMFKGGSERHKRLPVISSMINKRHLSPEMMNKV